MTDKTERPRAARPCPVCGKMSLAAHYPFCSPRCRQVDLHRWLTGAYAIPSAEPVEDDDPDHRN